MPRKLPSKKKVVSNPKRKSPRKQNVFTKYFWVIIGFLVTGVLFAIVNPYPSPITVDNIQQKMAHMILQPQQELETDAYVADIQRQSGEYDQSKLASIYDNKPAMTVPGQLASEFVSTVQATELDKVLGANDNKWIEIDLGQQKIRAWENGEKKMEFLISSGKPWTPTPTGEYRIWIKLRYTNMVGGSKEAGDYYNLPNVPYVMYFYKGYGIHGAYWHMNFGHPMSHGCVNVKPDEAAQLFNWATPDMQGKSTMKSTDDNPGTRVVVHN